MHASAAVARVEEVESGVMRETLFFMMFPKTVRVFESRPFQRQPAEACEYDCIPIENALRSQRAPDGNHDRGGNCSERTDGLSGETEVVSMELALFLE